MEPVIIKTSTAKLMVGILYSMPLIVIAAFMSILETGFLMAFGLLGLTLFLSAFLFLVYRIITNASSVLIVSEHGITDNTTKWGLGFIPWADINDMYIYEYTRNAKLLIIIVDKPDKYIAKTKYAVLRAIMRFSDRFYGSPLVISLSPLHDVPAARRTMFKAYSDYKAKSR